MTFKKCPLHKLFSRLKNLFCKKCCKCCSRADCEQSCKNCKKCGCCNECQCESVQMDSSDTIQLPSAETEQQ